MRVADFPVAQAGACGIAQAKQTDKNQPININASTFAGSQDSGKITFTGTREVMLNDRPERLAPGVVVRNERNTVALTGSLRGNSFTVNYLRDPMGLVREVWILTPAEAERPVRGQAMMTERETPVYAN